MIKSKLIMFSAKCVFDKSRKKRVEIKVKKPNSGQLTHDVLIVSSVSKLCKITFIFRSKFQKIKKVFLCHES